MAPVAFLPKLFRWVFTILVVLFGIGAFAICVLLVVNPHLPGGAHFGPVNLNVGGQPGTIVMRPAGADSDLVISAFRGTITFAINQAGGLVEVLKHYGLPLMLLRVAFF